MAKEVIQGEVVEVLEDEGPEEGEIEDDTSDEDNVRNYDLCPSNSAQVNTTIGAKYYVPPSTSSSEIHSLKPQLHSEDKTEQCWGSTARRHYKFYVDHDKPSRESYNRLKKSDLNSDHRGINFHELLIDYKTSKHGNEGNTHEKENRHYAKEVRVDSSRKRESGQIDVQVEKIKRSRKRKHRRSSSRSPISSETDVSRRKKDIKTSRPKRKKKLNSGIRNYSESAALFAQIRASKLNLAAAEQRKSNIEVINVASEGENATEIHEKCLVISRSVVSEGESCLVDKDCEYQSCTKEEGLQKEPTKYDSNKFLCTASDTQTGEKIEDSESKDEDDDDVNQLRMIALQSAFRAKYLERKRRGLVVRKQTKKTDPNVSITGNNEDSIFNLDDTADLLEAAVEEAVASCQNKETSPLPEITHPVSQTSLSEVPLPPDEPKTVLATGPSLIEDLTPVDMELALTDEEENTDQVKCGERDVQFESMGTTYPRISRCLPKTRNIPVTIGRNQNFKSRQRLSNNGLDNSRRINLLEVKTSVNEEQNVDDIDSNCISMTDVNMGSMIVLDAVGTCSSPEGCQVLEEDQTLSETSDAKSDLLPTYGGLCSMSGNDIDDEDEELLRARLLLDISSRHRKEEPTTASSLPVESVKPKEPDSMKVNTHTLVRTIHTEANDVNPLIKLNGNSSFAPVATLTSEKSKTYSKRNMGRMRRGQLLVKSHGQETALSNQVPVLPFSKARLLKISNRGKYQRVNQTRLAMIKKRHDGNIRVTVPCSSTNAKVLTQIPQQQDRIVICLGEDSDESEDEKQKTLVEGIAVAKNSASSQEQPKSTDSLPTGNVSVDFEKSVDLFLKEVRLVQESKSKNLLSTSRPNVGKGEMLPVQSAAAKPKVSVNTPKTQPAKSGLKPITGLTPQAVRHLPFPQQEEYRRLKMQISILEELHKKRKAAEATQISLKNDHKIGSVGSGSVSKSANQTAFAGVTVEKESEVNKSNNCPSALSNASSYSVNRQAEPVVEVNDQESSLQTDGGNDDDDEDENLMREQLLRSRLCKRVAAMAVASSPKVDVVSNKIDSIPSNTESVLIVPDHSTEECTSKMELKPSEDEIPLLNAEVALSEVTPSMEVVTRSKMEVLSEKEIALSNEGDVSSIENTSHSKMEETPSVTETVTSKENTTHSNTEELPSLTKEVPSVVESTPIETDHASRIEPVNASDVEVKQVVDKIKVMKANEVSAISEPKAGEINVGTEKIIPACSFSPGPVEGMKCENSTFKVSVNHESCESKASQLVELEFQLLSERHAALKYLSELSQLLNKMEMEGNRLKHKETAVKKLKDELSQAEVALDSQKKFMKQLALNVSSTHERVTATRQRCTMLSRACLKLGNQIKEDEIANGGEKTIYKVPTGGAELVKSQLSSVLCHTKQLKKSGLPFLGLAQEFIGKEGYPVKKSGKRYIVAHTQSQATVWAKQPTSSDRLSLKAEKKNPAFFTSKFVKTVKTSPFIRNSVVSNSASKLEATETVIATPHCFKRTSSIAKSALALSKPTASSKSSVTSTTCSITSNQIPRNGVHLPDSSDKAIKVVPSNAVTSAITSISASKACESESMRPVTSGSSFTLLPSETNKKIASGSAADKGTHLRDYHSPLEPISARTCSESLTVAVSSGSPKVESEDTVMLDPNIILCPYDLMGVCQDEECIYQHQRRKGVVKES